nr:hypothetical protein Iba_chr09fCG2340 [Ipomoea batatas]
MAAAAAALLRKTSSRGRLSFAWKRGRPPSLSFDAVECWPSAATLVVVVTVFVFLLMSAWVIPMWKRPKPPKPKDIRLRKKEEGVVIYTECQHMMMLGREWEIDR